MKDDDKKSSLGHWEPIPNFFIASLPILVRGVAVAEYLNGSQYGGRAHENLRASLFNDNLSNEPTFSHIHLAEQYL
jgi:hypothetical protein